MPSPRICLRIPDRLCRLIEARRGDLTLSAWLRDAASHRVAVEAGLGEALVAALAEHDRQIRGLGINLNQLAHAANEGRPVVLNREMLASLQGLLRETRTLLAEIKQRLPE